MDGWTCGPVHAHAVIYVSEQGEMKLLTQSVVPQSSVKNVFIRGSVVRYVHLPHNAVDVTLLEDATRRGKLFVPTPTNSSVVD